MIMCGRGVRIYSEKESRFERGGEQLGTWGRGLQGVVCDIWQEVIYGAQARDYGPLRCAETGSARSSFACMVERAFVFATCGGVT